MISFKEEINRLIERKRLPNNEYLSVNRFTTHYPSSNDFLIGLLRVPLAPIVNGLYACYHATAAIWATLRAISNLLILKPGYSKDAVHDAGVHLTLSVALAAMAPVHALTYSLELLTRTISSWFTGEEPRDTLSNLGFTQAFNNTYQQQERYLPSSAYFKKSRFFSSYSNAFDVLSQAAAPVLAIVDTGLNSLYHAASAVISALDCIINFAICKPRHAVENIRDVGIHFSLSLSLALMTPINVLVETIAFVSRLGTTWIDACRGGEKDDESCAMRPR